MKGRLKCILAAAALFCAPLAWSQNSLPYSPPSAWSDQQQNGSTDQSQGDQSQDDQSQGDQSQSGSGDQSQSGAGGPQATFSHPEELPPLNLFGDVLSHTGVSFNTSLGITGLNQTGYNGQQAYWYASYLATAGVNIVQIRPTLMWSLGYSGGVDTITGIGPFTYSALNQNAHANITWDFAKRWQFRVKDTYMYSDDPFAPFFSYLGNPTPNNPNPVVYFANSVIEQNQGTADLTYRLGEHDTLDFFGGESFFRFLRGYGSQGYLPNLGSLWNSVTYSGGGFYQHDFSARWSVGGGYTFTAMDFGHGQSRAGVNMLQTFASYRISKTMSVSGWVGPEFTNSKDLIPLLCFPSGCLIETQHNSYFNMAEGATFRWQAPRGNTFGAQYSHSVANGGGLFGTVRSYQVTATYSRPINRNWRLGIGFYYLNDTSLTPQLGNTFLRGEQATIGFTRQLNDAWKLQGYYAYAHQVQNYGTFFGLPTNLDTSALGLTVSYVWNHSMGR